MKKIKYTLLISILLIMGCSRENSIELSCLPPLYKKDFKIELQVLGSNKSKIKIFDGNTQREVMSGYGENDWNISYRDSLFANFRHIITNRNDRHIYKFNFYVKNSIVFADINIQGVSSVHKTLIFKKLDKSI